MNVFEEAEERLKGGTAVAEPPEGNVFEQAEARLKTSAPAEQPEGNVFDQAETRLRFKEQGGTPVARTPEEMWAAGEPTTIRPELRQKIQAPKVEEGIGRLPEAERVSGAAAGPQRKPPLPTFQEWAKTAPTEDWLGVLAGARASMGYRPGTEPGPARLRLPTPGEIKESDFRARAQELEQAKVASKAHYKGWGSVFLHGLARGSLNTVAALDRTWARFQPALTLGPRGSHYIADVAQNVIDEHPDWQPKQVDNAAGLLLNPKVLMQHVTEMLPYAGSTVATTLIAGPQAGVLVGGAIAYAVEGDGAYQDAIAKGATEERARLEGDIVGVVNAVIEVAQVRTAVRFIKGGQAKFAREVATKAIAKGGIVRKSARMAIRESMEEVLQGAVQEGTAKIVGGREIEGGLGAFLDRRLQEAVIAGLGWGGIAVAGRAAAAGIAGQPAPVAAPPPVPFAGEAAVTRPPTMIAPSKTALTPSAGIPSKTALAPAMPLTEAVQPPLKAAQAAPGATISPQVAPEAAKPAEAVTEAPPAKPAEKPAVPAKAEVPAGEKKGVRKKAAPLTEKEQRTLDRLAAQQADRYQPALTKWQLSRLRNLERKANLVTREADRAEAEKAYAKAITRSAGGMWRSAESAAEYGKWAGLSADRVFRDLRKQGYADKDVVGFMAKPYGRLEAEGALSRIGSKEWEARQAPQPAPAEKPAAKEPAMTRAEQREIGETLLARQTAEKIQAKTEQRAKEPSRRFISEESYKEATKRLSEPKVPGGLVPFSAQDIKDAATVLLYHFESGVRKLADLTTQLAGQIDKRLIRQAWNQTREVRAQILKGERALLESQVVLPTARVKAAIRRATGLAITEEVETARDLLRYAMKTTEQASVQGYMRGARDVMESWGLTRKAPPTERVKATVRRTTGQVDLSAKVSEAKALKASMRQAQKVSAEAYRLGEKVVVAAHKRLTEFAQAELPQSEWAKVEKAISRSRTLAQFRQVIASVDILKEHYEQQSAMKEFRGVLKEVRKTKLRPEYQERASALLESIAESTPTDQTLQKANRLMEYLGTSEEELSTVPGSEIAYFREALARHGRTPVRKLPAESIRAISRYFQHILTLNAKKNEIIFGRRKRNRVEMTQKATEEVLTAGPTKQRNWDRAPGLMSNLFSSALINPDTLVYGLAGDSGAAYQIFVSNMVDGMARASEIQTQASDYLSAKLEVLGVSERQLKKMSDACARPPRMWARLWKRMTGQPPTRAAVREVKTPWASDAVTEQPVNSISMTSAEMVEFLCAVGDSSTRAEILKHRGKGISFEHDQPRRAIRLTAETLQAIQEQATPLERQISKAMTAYFNGPLRDDLNAAWVDQKGYEIARQRDYWPRRRDAQFREMEPDKILNEWVQTMLDEQGIFKPRTGGRAPILIGDAFATFVAHTNKVGAFIGKHPAVLDAMSVLQTPEFRRAILSRRMGAERYAKLQKVLRTYIGVDYPDQGWVDRVMRTFTRRAHVAALALKPQIPAYQPLSYALALTEIGPKPLARGLGPGLGSRAQVEGEIRRHSPYIWQRLQGTGHQILTPSNLGTSVLEGATGRTGRALTDKILAPIRATDLATIRRLWRASKAWAADQGYTGDELLSQAAKKCEAVVMRTQPTWDVLTRSGISQFASDHPLALPLSMFTSQPSKNYNIAARAVFEYGQSGKGWKDATKMVSKVGLAIIAQAALVYLVQRGLRRGIELAVGRPRRREPDATDHAIGIMQRTLGNIQVVGPVLSIAAERVIRRLKGKPQYGERTGNIFYDTLSDTYEAAEAWAQTWIDYESDAEYKEYWRKGEKKWQANLLRAAQKSLTPLGMVTGLPLPGLAQTRLLPEGKLGPNVWYDILWDAQKRGDEKEVRRAMKELKNLGAKASNLLESAKSRGHDAATRRRMVAMWHSVKGSQ